MRSNRPIAALLSMGGIALLCGCGKDTDRDALKAEIAEVRRAYAEAEQELTPLRESYAAAIEREKSLQASLKDAQIAAGRLQIQNQSLEDKFKKQEDRLGEILDTVEETHQKHQKELEALRKEFEEYKRKYRISLRLRAPGTQLPDLEYAGVTYENPVVTCATPAALEIRHADGIAILDFAYLSSSVRKRFGYHPGEAAEYARFQQENRAENLVNHLAAVKEEATYEQKVELRILYKDWENKVARADLLISRKEADIRSSQNQLRQTSSRSSAGARIRNDLERLNRDLFFLKRDRSQLNLEEPFNPDAE